VLALRALLGHRIPASPRRCRCPCSRARTAACETVLRDQRPRSSPAAARPGSGPCTSRWAERPRLVALALVQARGLLVLPAIVEGARYPGEHDDENQRRYQRDAPTCGRSALPEADNEHLESDDECTERQHDQKRAQDNGKVERKEHSTGFQHSHRDRQSCAPTKDVVQRAVPRSERSCAAVGSTSTFLSPGCRACYVACKTSSRTCLGRRWRWSGRPLR
jgi:hypothetical protein